jgi:hypothetical protein
MSGAVDLDHLRRATPRCAGVALFQGTSLEVVDSSGQPTIVGWATWSEVCAAVPALLREGPLPSSEVLLRLPTAMLLLTEHGDSIVAVVIELTKAGAGVALVQARVTASKVLG